MKKEVNKVLSLPYEGDFVDLEFKPLTKLTYANVFKHFKEADHFEAIDVILKNCYVKGENGIDLINDQATKMSMANQIISKLLVFKPVDISITYSGKKHKKSYDELVSKHGFVFVVTIDAETEENESDGESVVFLKPLKDRFQYKEIFNLNIKSPLRSLDYIYKNLYLGGDNINKNIVHYVSCFSISDYILTFKDNQFKKK